MLTKTYSIFYYLIIIWKQVSQDVVLKQTIYTERKAYFAAYFK